MHMPKVLLTVGAAALCLAAVNATAQNATDAEQLREALRQKMAELNAKAAPAPAAPVKAAPATPAKAAPATPAKAAPAATTKAAAPTSKAPVATASSDDEALRAALHARMAEEKSAAQPAPVAEPPVAAPVAEVKPVEPVKPVATQPASKPSGFAPMAAPPSPLNGSKAERLQQLLDQYKADQITPQEYHTQRAKIIAE